MKKLISLVLVAMMLLTLAACASSQPAAEAPAAPAAAAEEPAAEAPAATGKDSYRIGFLFSDFENTLGQMVKKQVEIIGEALNIEFVYTADQEVADDQINSLENVLSSGVDGILIAPSSTSMAPKIVSMCAEAEVPVMFCFRDMTYDPEVLAQIEANPYFLGCTFEGESNASYHMCQYLNSIGHTNTGFIWFPSGAVLNDTRQDGMHRAIDEGIVKEAGSYTWDPADPVNSMIEACEYFVTTTAGQVDSILLISSAIAGSATTAVLENYNVAGDITIATFDQFDGMEKAFDTGSLAISSCGHHTDPYYALIVLMNYLNGTALSDKPVRLTCNYLFLTSAADCTLFSDYMNLNKVVYDLDTAKSMIGNGFTLADLEKAMADYSIDILK